MAYYTFIEYAKPIILQLRLKAYVVKSTFVISNPVLFMYNQDE